MQTIKNLATFVWHGGASLLPMQIKTSIISMPKRTIDDSSWTIPDQVSKISVLVWYWPKWPDDSFGILSNEEKMGLICKYLWLTIWSSRTLSHPCLRIHSNGKYWRTVSSQTIIEEKDLTSSNSKITVRPSTALCYLRSNSNSLKMWRRSSLPHLVRTRWPRRLDLGIPQRRSHLVATNYPSRPRNIRERNLFISTLMSTRKAKWDT